MSDEMLVKLNATLDVDILRQMNGMTKKFMTKTDLKQCREFVMYLVSVATHPIGLRASVPPFNSSSEHMLAFLMDLFSLDDASLRNIFTRDETKSPRFKNDQPFISGKRHSWRPELRVRIDPPRFYYREQDYQENLHVRVYLFKKASSDRDEEQKDGKPKGHIKSTLEKIFDRLRPDLSVLIRPVGEMRSMIKFERLKQQPVNSNPSKLELPVKYRMIQVTPERSMVDQDIHLNIRRYYCDQELLHILRFEYWLNMDNINANLLNQFRHMVRSLVYNGCYNQIRRGENRSVYMNESQRFYGYTNIELTQIPSYATKQSYPIKNLYDKTVNHCEIGIEPRNRTLGCDVRTEKLNALRSKRDDNIRNHIRLYANCLLFHCVQIESRTDGRHRDGDRNQNVILDSLLYLPAHTLINQNRLQCGLNNFDDLSLRRIAILILLVKLEKQVLSGHILAVENKLMSVLKSEYSLVRRQVDERTMHEVDPFCDGMSSSGDTINLELTVLWSFVIDFIQVKIKRLALDPQDEASRVERAQTLFSLKVARTAISHFSEHLELNATMREDVLRETSRMRSAIERSLCQVILEQIKSRFIMLLDSMDLAPVDSGKMRLAKNLRQEGGSSTDHWLSLLHSIRCLNHDLSLSWSRDALDGIMKRERSIVKKIGLFEALVENDIRASLKRKIDNYLM